jgi:uncharacterized protein
MDLPLLLGRFVSELRAAGLPVSVTESMDAHRALGEVPLLDKAAVRSALACCLIKQEGHMELFDFLFDFWWTASGPAPGDPRGGDPAARLLLGAAGDSKDSAVAAADLGDKLAQLLRSWDDRLGEVVAAAAVRVHAGLEGADPTRPAGMNYYLFRTLRGLRLDEVVAAMTAAQAGAVVGVAGGGPGGGPQGALGSWLAAARVRRSAEQLRLAITSELRRRLVAARGAAELALANRPVLIEEMDFAHASTDELAAMQERVRPLAIRLAARLERRRRRGRRGALDFRATMRRSLSTGGVPLETRWRRPRPAKPEIFVLADVSGSVAAFSRFSLVLVHALSAQFTRVRSFAFVDEVDEVSSYFGHDQDFAAVVVRIREQAAVVGALGHSHYGRALSSFAGRFGEEVGARTTVLVLGDARNNYHPAQVEALASVADRARRLYWLDPEPRAYWNSGDSVLGLYAPCCDAVFECRNLSQLEKVVSQLD